MKSSHFNKYLVFMLTILFTLSAGFNALADPKKDDKQPVNINKLVKQAVNDYEHGEFQDALTKFEQAYEAGNREDSALLYNIGRVYESMADYNNANNYYKQFIMAPGSEESARQDALDRINKNMEFMQVVGAVPSNTAPPKAAGKTTQKTASSKSKIPIGSCVDINNASEKELTALPGIGESYAKKIVAGRPYQTPADIKKVKGIGDGKFNKMASMICPINGIGSVVAVPPPQTATEEKVIKPIKDPKIKKPVNKKAVSKNESFDF